MIYFAQPSDGGPVKIGCTINVPARIRTLETRYGRSLKLLATMEGEREQEQAIHTRFAHLRLNGRRKGAIRLEQFRPAPELMEFIGVSGDGGIPYDAVEPMEANRDSCMDGKLSLITRIEQLMAERGLTASEVARRAGIHKQALNQFLSGATIPKLFTLFRFAKAFEMTASELCKGVGEVPDDESP